MTWLIAGAILIGILFLVGIWYNGKSYGETKADAAGRGAEATSAREKAAALEKQRAADNEAARQKDVREATDALRTHRADEFLFDSYKDDPSTN